MWLIFLTIHQYLSGVKQGLWLRTNIKKETCHYEIGVYAQDITIILGSIVDIVEMASMIS
jgi:hypothetical protein